MTRYKHNTLTISPVEEATNQKLNQNFEISKQKNYED